MVDNENDVAEAGLDLVVADDAGLAQGVVVAVVDGVAGLPKDVVVEDLKITLPSKDWSPQSLFVTILICLILISFFFKN